MPASVEVPRRAQFIRVMVLELSRIASHLFAFGGFAGTLGLYTLPNWTISDRDRILELFEALIHRDGEASAMEFKPRIVRERRLDLLIDDELHVAKAVAGLPVERVRADLFDHAALAAALEGVEVVYHLAARVSIESGDEEQVFRVNVEGVRRMMQACLEAGVRRVVHFSSIHAFAQQPFFEPLDETRQPPGPDAPPYDRSKAAGEREVVAAVQRGLDVVIVNPTSVLGPWDFKPSPMGEAILGAIHRRLPALVEGGFDWVDVRDVVAGAMAAEERGRTGERYLLSGQWLPIADLIRQVCELTGVRPPRFTSPMWLARAAAPLIEQVYRCLGRRPLYTSASLCALRSNRCVSHQRAARELGYQPRPLRETLVDTICWHAEQGNLPAGVRLDGIAAAAG
jgi:dihydroflavonol-4-reductase